MIRVFRGTCSDFVPPPAVVVRGANPMDAGIMLATDRDKGFSAWIVTEGQRVTLLPRQLTILVVIIADFALTVELGCG